MGDTLDRMDPASRVYPPDQRPDVEVRLDGEDLGELWVEGELRSWSRGPEGWWANCSWRAGPGQNTHLDTFPADHVREDTVDRSYGRDLTTNFVRGSSARLRPDTRSVTGTHHRHARHRGGPGRDECLL